MKKPVAAIALIIATLGTTQAALAGNLIVNVTNLQSAAGTVQIALFNSAQGFPETDARLIGHLVQPRGNSAVTVFRDLAPGHYAIAVFQDVNGDGQLNKTLFGVPTEPFGFSNIGSSRLSKQPQFTEAAIEMNRGNSDITVRVTQ